MEEKEPPINKGAVLSSEAGRVVVILIIRFINKLELLLTEEE